MKGLARKKEVAMSNGDSRYHAEVKGSFEGREIRVNVFADTLIRLFSDFLSAVEYLVNPAKVEENGKSLPPTQPPAKQPAKPNPIPKAPAPTDAPVCANCGSSQSMELIDFTDKKTGERKQAWKCQECLKWVWDN